MKITTRGAVAVWLDGLAEDYTVVAPRLVGDELLYGLVLSSDEIVFDFQRTALSPKSYFLPDTEVILEMQKRDKEVTLTEPALERDQVIFGLRPCDAQGLRALDALLLDRPPPDTYYAERRERTTLVGQACPQLWSDCFCTSLGSAPDDASGVDLMLYQESDDYLLEVVTDKGATLLAGLEIEETDRPAPPADTTGAQVPVLPPEEWGVLFDDLYWQRLAERCLSCHACTYVCPTCRCFDVRDDAVAAGPGYAHIQRLRAWDSCMAAAYRRIAGGHNPRPTKAQRLRNRYFCKFCYSSLDFGATACVGCGRCIAICPVGVDIAEMLADVTDLKDGD
ncbi:MAG: 4Fe-4S dicluster domain-containing protein [Anaerolineae bacterium]|jgi:ferredoxin